MMKHDWHRTWQKVRAGFDTFSALVKKDRRVRVFLVVASTVLILVVLSVVLERSKNTAPVLVFSLPLFMLALTYFDARNRPTLISLALIALSVMTLLYLQSFLFWIRLIGTDSLAEIQSFEWEEALFFINTLGNLIPEHKVVKPIQIFLTWFAVGGLAFYLLTRYRHVYTYAVKHIVFSLAVVWVFYTSYDIYSLSTSTITIRDINRSGFTELMMLLSLGLTSSRGVSSSTLVNQRLPYICLFMATRGQQRPNWSIWLKTRGLSYSIIRCHSTPTRLHLWSKHSR